MRPYLPYDPTDAYPPWSCSVMICPPILYCSFDGIVGEILINCSLSETLELFV